MMNGVGDKSANQGLIESAWIYKRSENFPTLVTCYIVGGGKNWLPNVTYESIFADGTLVRNDEHPQRLPQPTWEYVKLHMGPRIEKRIMQNGRVFQERYYNEKGYPVKDVDYTSPTFPDGRPFADHAEPDHEHLWIMKNSEKPQDGWMRQGGDI
jgi:hypothetical protein